MSVEVIREPEATVKKLLHIQLEIIRHRKALRELVVEQQKLRQVLRIINKAINDGALP